MNIKDLKVGDELVCVKGGHSHLEVGETYIVIEITNGHIRFKGVGVSVGWYLDGALQYMKKKERASDDQQCNLKYGSLSYRERNEMMIDMAVKAVKDGVIKGGLKIQSHSVAFRANRNDYYFNQHYIDEAIEVIRSLYKETFVIECEEDIKRIKLKSEVTLSNNNKFIVDNVSDTFITPNNSFDKLTILSLKGATVEQSK